jgi:hypothetical protein
MIAQIGIVFFGVMAAWLTQQRNEQLKKYACIFGLISQPFWFYSAIETNQWGIFLLSIIYTAVWLVGFKNYWVKSSLPQQRENNSPLCECGKSKPKNKMRCFTCD